MSKEISNFVMPQKPSGKFVQHYINNIPFIRFSLNDEETPDKISERLLIDYMWAITNPAVTDRLAAKGFYRKLKDGIIQLYGDKYKEEVHPNQKHLNELASYLPEGIKLEIIED
jgi:hypothetical protein